MWTDKGQLEVLNHLEDCWWIWKCLVCTKNTCHSKFHTLLTQALYSQSSQPCRQTCHLGMILGIVQYLPIFLGKEFGNANGLWLDQCCSLFGCMDPCQTSVHCLFDFGNTCFLKTCYLINATLFSLPNLESPKLQKLSHWPSKLNAFWNGWCQEAV